MRIATISLLAVVMFSAAALAQGPRKVDPFDRRAIDNVTRERTGPFSKPRESEQPHRSNTRERVEERVRSSPVRPFHKDGHTGVEVRGKY